MVRKCEIYYNNDTIFSLSPLLLYREITVTVNYLISMGLHFDWSGIDLVLKRMSFKKRNNIVLLVDVSMRKSSSKIRRLRVPVPVRLTMASPFYFSRDRLIFGLDILENKASTYKTLLSYTPRANQHCK